MSFQTSITDRVASLTERLNAIETNAKRTEELPAQDPMDVESEIRVSRAGISKRIKIQKIVDAVASLNYDRLLSIGTLDLTGNTLTIPALAKWSISNTILSNPADVEINIPFAATGTSREDLIYANASNQILRIAGPEDANIVVGPNLPLNTVQVTRILVTDSSIGTPTEPIIGDSFVTKISLQDNPPVLGFGTGEDWSLSFDGINGKSGFPISGVIESIADIQIPGGEITTPPVLGSLYTITNIKATPIVIKHGSPNNIPFNNPENSDLVVPPGCVALYRYEGTLMRFVSLGIKPGASDQGIQSAISKDPIITEENILPLQDASGVTYAGNAEDSGMVSVRNNSSDAMPQAQIATIDSFGVPKQGVQLYKGKMMVLDSVSRKGLQYDEDYSGTFVNESLVSKRYADSLVTGLLDLRGNHDASTNLFPSSGGSGTSGAILKGDLYIVSVVGTLGGKTVTPGDMLVALVDTPGQTSANWNQLELNIGYVPENSANRQNSMAADGTGTKYPTVDAVISALAAKQAALVSGTNIKTIGGQSILGSGDLLVPLPPAIHDTTARTYTGSTSYPAGSYTIPANTIPANCTLILTARAFKTGTAGTYSLSMASTSTPQVRLLNLVGSGSATNTYMHVTREITIGGGKARYFDTSGSTYHTFAANNAVYANVDFDVTIPQTFNLTIAANSADTVIFDSILLQILK